MVAGRVHWSKRTLNWRQAKTKTPYRWEGGASEGSAVSPVDRLRPTEVMAERRIEMDGKIRWRLRNYQRVALTEREAEAVQWEQFCLRTMRGGRGDGINTFIAKKLGVSRFQARKLIKSADEVCRWLDDHDLLMGWREGLWYVPVAREKSIGVDSRFIA